MRATTLHLRLRRFYASVLTLTAICCATAVAQAGVYLSSYTFNANARPYIYTNESLPSPYKLRLKIMGVPGYPDGFHAANGWNNNYATLDSVPTPGTYYAELYWLTYASDYATLTGQGPGYGVTVVVQQAPANAVSWGAINLPAAGLPGTTISFTATVTNSGNTTWDGNYYLELKDWNETHLYYPSISGVGPGGSTTVTFWLTLPASAGSYTYGFTALQNGVQYFGGTQYRTIAVNRNPVTSSFTATPTTISGGMAVDLTSVVTDPDSNLTSQAIDYIPPAGGNWVSGTGGAGTRWDGSATGSNTLYKKMVLSNVGTWQFRARGGDALGGLSDFIYRNVSVTTPTPIAVTLSLDSTSLSSGQTTIARSTATPAGELTYHGVEGRLSGGTWQNWGIWDDTGGTQQTTAVGPSTAGTYEVRAYAARADAVAAYSASVTLNSSGPPAITSQPVSQTVNSGQNVTFSVTASGTAPLTYQWRRNGVNISGANGSSYTITNVQTSDAAGYTVVVTNSLGSVTSNAATLTVTNLQSIRLAVKYWQANDYPGIQAESYEDVWVDGQWVEDGYWAWDEEAQEDVWVSEGSHWEDGHYESQYVGTTTYPDGQYGSTWTTTAGTFDINTAASGYNSSATNRGYFVHSYQPGDLITFHLHGMAPSANCNDYTWALYNPYGAYVTGNWFNPSYAWSFWVQYAGYYRVDVTYYNANATPGTGTVSYYIPVGVTPPPTISTQPAPASQTVASGATVTYTVVASGATAYQWRKDGVAIAGANSATLTLSNVQSTSSGSYTVVVSNAGGSVTSDAVSLTVSLTAPSITTQPVGLVRNAGQSATFSVVVSGSAPLAYQWRKNGTAISGATGSSYTIANVQAADAAAYSVAVSNSAGSVTSDSASLTVTAVAPSIGVQPASQTANTGQPVTFTVTATGTAPLSYQWRKNAVAISGANSSSFAIASVQAADAATYSVVVSNSVGSATSSNATLTVNTTQPIRLAVKYWQANDYPGIPVESYEDVWVDGQWVEDGHWEWDEEAQEDVWVSDGTYHWEDGHYESQYLGTITYPDGQYGSTWTTTAGTFDINTAASGYDPNAADRGYFIHGYNAGDLVTFHLFTSAPSANCSNYEFKLYNPSGGQIAGNWFTSPYAWSFNPSTTGVYRIELRYYGATSTTLTSGTVNYYVPVGVSIPPQITVQPGPATQTVNAGATISYSVTANGASAYQWYKDNVAISGANASMLTLNNVQSANAGAYKVVVSNSAGSTTSNTVTLSVDGPPVIVTQPISVTVTVGQPATFTVEASGSGTLTYQWRKGGVSISGATGASISFASAQTSDAGPYDVIVSNAAGATPSAVATLTVNSVGDDGTAQLKIHRPL